VWSRKLERELEAAKREIEQLKEDTRNRSEFLCEHGHSVRTHQALIYMERLCHDLVPEAIGVNRDAGMKIIGEIRQLIRHAQRVVAVRQEMFDFPDIDLSDKVSLEKRIEKILNERPI
jgi:hypothetical protein